MKKSYEMDMCNGPLLGKMLVFTLPLMLSGILQLLFNAADIVVVGKFSGSLALAAVGSTGALINLFINVFIGFSIGTNVLVAHYFGARDKKNVHETVHTSILLGLIGGVILIVAGIFLAKPMLELMDTPEDVIGQAVLYMRIYFAGMPAMLVYNFGAAILRAIGDTQRPLYYLLAAGVVNVILNLFFVIVLEMGVAGVALATVISQVISAVLIIRCLMHSDGMYRLELRQLRIHKSKMMRIMQIGLPAGLQGAVFSLSNMLIQSSINSFGSIAMAGSTAAGNLEGFVYTAMNSVYQTALSFTSQNIGGGRQDRILKIMVRCLIIVAIVGAVMGNAAYQFGPWLLEIYSSDAEVIRYGMSRMQMICQVYFFCGMMDVMVGMLRGLGYSIAPMLVSLAGACGLRVLWIFTVFQWKRSLFTLYLSYPITWIVTLLVHVICFTVIWRRKKGIWARTGVR
jgi:putative MATE family efflux protein